MRALARTIFWSEVLHFRVTAVYVPYLLAILFPPLCSYRRAADEYSMNACDNVQGAMFPPQQP